VNRSERIFLLASSILAAAPVIGAQRSVQIAVMFIESLERLERYKAVATVEQD
jgi:hypothetical protein